MKALSLWQPYATLISLGLKAVETRGWRMDYRGPLVICSTTGKSRGERAVYDWLRMKQHQNSDACRIMRALASAGIESLKDLPLGKALCVVEVVDCLPTGMALNAPWLTKDERAFGDYSPGRYAILTVNCKRFVEPFSIRGKQKLFDIELPDWIEYVA